MASFFSRSLRAIKADSCRRSMVGLLLAVVILGFWAIWLFMAKIAMYEVSRVAWVEVDQKAHSLDARISGRVLANNLVLGQEVQAKDLLVELDTTTQQLMMGEEEASLDSLNRQFEALSDELTAQRQAQYEYRQMRRRAVDEAQARRREAEVELRLREDEMKQLAVLHDEGILSNSDFLKARAEVEKQREASGALAHHVGQMKWEDRNHDSQNRVRVEQIKRDLARLKGEIAAKTLTIERLRCEIDKGHVCASVAGHVGEARDLRVGTMINEGESIGTILPPGQLKIVATFPPSASVGRIRPGQPARLRLDSFHWTQYGSISGRVARVASEPSEGSDGYLRAELAIVPDLDSPIPLQHGLLGSVEVEVDHMTPARLMLQAVGKLLTKPTEKSGNENSGTAAESGGKNVR